jgi:hypothetical protein
MRVYLSTLATEGKESRRVPCSFAKISEAQTAPPARAATVGDLRRGRGEDRVSR